jgi:hypothetical protein
MNRFLLVITACTLLGGCAHSDVVDLKKPGAETAHCGPFKANVLGDDKVEADYKLQDCIKGYEAQGYKRMD